MTVPPARPPRSLGLVRTAAATTTLGVVGALLLSVPATATAAPSSTVVVNEVYGGGGNSGATLTTDFVELANRGPDAVDLSNWSVQYLPASPSPTSQWQVTPLSGLVDPGAAYLVAEATGSGGTQPLPTPDASGSIALAGASGTVALVSSAGALTCRTAADCAADASIVDLVGYGAAVVRESTPAPGLSNTTSAQRTDDADTDVNSADFGAGEPTPKAPNATEPGGGGPTEPGEFRIHDLQGPSWISPLDDQTVEGVPGIVTAVRDNGFFLQDPNPDADPITSEGLFVFTGNPPATTAGDSVLVSGRVQDFYTLSQGETVETTSSLSVTEIGDAVFTVLSSGNPLPAAEVIEPDTLPDLYAPDAGGQSIESLPLDPTASTLDWWETREGMLVEIDDAHVTGPSNEFGEAFVTAKPEEFPTPSGGTILTGYDAAPTGRALLTPVDGEIPELNVGDVLAGPTVGPVDWSTFGGYSIAATTLGTVTPGGLTPEVAEPGDPDKLSVATYNVENLDAADDPAKFAQLANGVVTSLASPDILTLEEIQDDNGEQPGGTTAELTLQTFVDAIVVAGGPAYEWRQIDPENNTDGGAPDGNIRVGFLFNPDRVSFVDHPGGDATTATTVSAGPDGKAEISLSPGRVDPTNPAWVNSRKPLVGEFEFQGQQVFVVANHFASKGGDQNAAGRFQPPARSSEVQRHQQAATLNTFVSQILAVDPDANVVVAGDLNDFQFSQTLSTLTAGADADTPILSQLMRTLPADEQYSYVFSGVSQVLDHLLVSPALSDVDYDVVHVNAEFAAQASDHDPQLARLTFDSSPPGHAGGHGGDHGGGHGGDHGHGGGHGGGHGHG